MKTWLFSALTYCALAGVAQAAGVSGTYVGTAPNSAVLLQLVQTQSGSLVGRFEQYYVAPRATQVQIINASVTGDVGGHTVVLQIKLAEAFGGTIPASGDIEGRTMDLSGGRMGSTFEFHLVRSSMQTFQSQWTRLAMLANGQAQMQASAAAAKKRLKQLRDGRENVEAATAELDRFDAGTPAELHKIDSIIASFPHFTHVMRRLLAREETIPMPSGQFQRGQLVYTINQGSFDTNSQHFALERHEFAVGYEHGRIAPPSPGGEVGRAQAFCAAPDQAKAPWCMKFAGALGRFTADRHALNVAFDHAEASYASEHVAQKQIEQQASNLAYPTN